MENMDDAYKQSRRARNNGITSQVVFGIILAVAGLGLLLRKSGVPLPQWLFRWEMILIVVGVVGGIKNQFRDLGWLIPIIIGCIFISNDVFPQLKLRGYIWPIGLITLGLVIAYNARNRKQALVELDSSFTVPPAGSSNVGSGTASSSSAANDTGGAYTSSDVLNVTAILGGAKRIIVSKNFLGGEIVSVLGGAEINLANADIQGPVTLESVNILGGTKLVVPSDWDVQSQVVSIFGGVDDKRHISPGMINPRKKLILIGTSFMGGLEIKNY